MREVTLTGDQFILVIALVKLGVMASLTSLLVRSRRFTEAIFTTHRTIGTQAVIALWLGLPFTERSLNQTRTGGTPYGATHVSGMATQPGTLSDDEIVLAQALGKRVADVAATLAAGRAARRNP